MNATTTTKVSVLATICTATSSNLLPVIICYEFQHNLLKLFCDNCFYLDKHCVACAYVSACFCVCKNDGCVFAQCTTQHSSHTTYKYLHYDDFGGSDNKLLLLALFQVINEMASHHIKVLLMSVVRRCCCALAKRMKCKSNEKLNYHGASGSFFCHFHSMCIVQV